jgi:iron(III) transport system substrate-binding protein
MVLAFNPARHARNTIPNSFYDFAHDARFRNVISMGSPLTSGTTLAAVAALSARYGEEYFDALGRQNVHIEYSGSNAITKLEAGEYRVIMILEESILQQRQENNSRLEVIYPSDGTVVIPSNIMIINDQWSANRNTAAAQAISDWFLSEEGQNAIVAGWMHSVRTNFEKIPNDSISTGEILNNSLPVNWENVFRQRENIRNRFERALTLRQQR